MEPYEAVPASEAGPPDSLMEWCPLLRRAGVREGNMGDLEDKCGHPFGWVKCNFIGSIFEECARRIIRNHSAENLDGKTQHTSLNVTESGC